MQSPLFKTRFNHKVKFIKMQNSNLQTEHMAKVTYEICKNLYNEKGAIAVYNYCDKIKRKFHYCKQCECDTPTIQSIKLCICAVCGQNKPSTN